MSDGYEPASSGSGKPGGGFFTVLDGMNGSGPEDDRLGPVAWVLSVLWDKMGIVRQLGKPWIWSQAHPVDSQLDYFLTGQPRLKLFASLGFCFCSSKVG